jgi:hypothetical protein
MVAPGSHRIRTLLANGPDTPCLSCQLSLAQDAAMLLDATYASRVFRQGASGKGSSTNKKRERDDGRRTR